MNPRDLTPRKHVHRWVIELREPAAASGYCFDRGVFKSTDAKTSQMWTGGAYELRTTPPLMTLPVNPDGLITESW